MAETGGGGGSLLGGDAVQKLQQELLITRNTIADLQDEVRRKELSIAVLTKQLATAEHMCAEAEIRAATLHASLEDKQALSASLRADLRRKQTLAAQLTEQLDTPSTRYMHQCFQLGLSPNPHILKSLHMDTAVVCPDVLSYEELSVLAEVLTANTGKENNNSITNMNYSTTIGATGSASPLGMSGSPGGSPRSGAKREYTALHLQVRGNESHALLCEVIGSVPTITHLELPNLSDTALRSILHTIGTVDWIKSIAMPNPTMTDETLHELFDTLENPHHQIALEALDLRNADVEASGFSAIRSTSLRMLDLRDQHRLTDGALSGMLTRCPNLHTLLLDNCTQLTDNTPQAINTAGTSIVHLSVMGCTKIQRVVLQYVKTVLSDWGTLAALECPKLVEIPVPVVRFGLLSLRCPSLQRLTLTGITLSERELALLTDGCPSLMQLALPHCRATSLARLARLQRLQDLCLGDVRIVRDADIACLPSSIESLDLTNCYHITDGALHSLASRCTSMTAVSFRGCSNITDEGMETLVSRCGRIEWLDVSECKKLTPTGLEHVVQALTGVIKVLLHETFRSPGIQASPAVDDGYAPPRSQIFSRSDRRSQHTPTSQWQTSTPSTLPRISHIHNSQNYTSLAPSKPTSPPSMLPGLSPRMSPVYQNGRSSHVL